MSTVSSSALTPLIHCFLSRYPGEAGRVLESFSPKENAELLAYVPPEIAGQALLAMGSLDGARTLESCEVKTGSEILRVLDDSQAARLLSNTSELARKRWLDTLDHHRSKSIQEVLSYPLGTAGRLMTSDVKSVVMDNTVAQALSSLKSSSTTISELPVIDREGHLRGLITLHTLIRSDPDCPIATLLQPDIVYVTGMAPREEVVELLNLHKLRNLPVVDAHGILIGLIQHDVLVRAAQVDAAVEMQQMVGAGSQERALSTAWFAVRSRLPWLQINLLTAFLASAVVGIFEATIAEITALAVLLPVAAGQSGNTGAQALAVTMRGLALREIRTSHIRRVIRKEAAAGFINGVMVGAASGLGVFLWSQNLSLALLMATAMLVSMIMASMAGALIPAVLTILGRDPATAASIVLTTVTDVVGFMTFLGLARLFRDQILGT